MYITVGRGARGKAAFIDLTHPQTPALAGASVETRPKLLPFSYGTGSYPLPPHGWQRDKRLTVSHNPFNGPYLRSASSAYWEQVGVNRHAGGNSGEMHNW